MRGFEELYNTQGKAVYRFLLTLTGDAHQAEELLQETFYQAFVHIDRFEGADPPYEDLTLEDPSPPPEDAITRREEARRLRRAVQNLEDPHREVFILHAYGGLKLKEIAALHQKSESWARVTYFRARKILQEVLHDEI